MSNFWTLVGFEYRKLFQKKMIIMLLILSVGSAILVGILNVSGNGNFSSMNTDMSGWEGLKADRAVMLSNEGVVDEAMLKRIISNTHQVLEDKDNYYMDENGKEWMKDETSIKYKLPYYNVYFFLSQVYDHKGEPPISALNESDVDHFYDQYKVYLAEPIQANRELSVQEKEKHLQMIEKLDTPFYNDYIMGYKSFEGLFPMLGLLVLTAVAVICTNIFGKEFTNRTTSVILSSRYGKSKMITAKLFTGISLSILVSLGMSGLWLLSFLIIYGFTGGASAIQLMLGFAWSTYPLTMLSCTLLAIGTVAFVSAGFGVLSLLLSILFKKPVTSLTILFLIIIIPAFIVTDNRILLQLISLLPVRTFDFNALYSEYLYNVGSISLTPPVFYMILNIFLCVVLTPWIYRCFKKHQTL